MAGQLGTILRSLLTFVGVCSAFWAAAGSVSAEQFDATVRSVVGIRFERSTEEATEGMGVYVGAGRILTAAHLFREGEVGTRVVVIAVDGEGYYGVRMTGTVEMLDRDGDAAVVHVPEPGGLLPLPLCPAASAGDRVSLTRLSQRVDAFGSADGAYVLEIEDRVFVRVAEASKPVIPGSVQSGFSGGPALGGDGRCYYGVVSGTLTTVATYKDRARHSEQVVLVAPAAWTPIDAVRRASTSRQVKDRRK